MKVKVRKHAICVLSVGRISVRCRMVGIDLTEKLTNPQFSIYREQLPQNGGSNVPERTCTNIQKRASLMEAGDRCSQNRGLAGACGQRTPGAQSPAREINGGPVLLAPKLRHCTDEGRK